MSPSQLTEPDRIDEPRIFEDYAHVLSRVATDRRAIIVQRNGTDLAAVIPIEQLELIREMLAQQEVESMASKMDWEAIRKASPPAATWFEGGEPKPF